MANPPVAVTFPPINTPLANPDGTMNRQWYLFFSALFERSGLNTPGIGLEGTFPATPNTAAPAFYVDTSAFPAVLVVLNQFNGTSLGSVNL